MWKRMVRSFLAVIILTLIVCGAYPLAVTGIAQAFFRSQANGGLIYDKAGKPVGAHLIGQSFSRPEYFHGRPSAAGSGYDAASSSGSNLGPTNQKLANSLRSRAEEFVKDHPYAMKGQIPVEMVTSSGSGLDPHISPEAALIQVKRVATARKMPESALEKMVREHVEQPRFGFLGEPVVNVLELNLLLDGKT